MVASRLVESVLTILATTSGYWASRAYSFGNAGRVLPGMLRWGSCDRAVSGADRRNRGARTSASGRMTAGIGGLRVRSALGPSHAWRAMHDGQKGEGRCQ